MVRRIAAAFLTLGLLACAEVPPPPEAGGEGGGGVGGAGGRAGASGGVAGGGGTGDASDAGVDSCEFSKADGTESNDDIQDGKALGFVCSDGECREGFDPFDRWSLKACGGRNTLLLTWTNNDGTSNLDLLLFAANDDQLDQSMRLSGDEEEIDYLLEAAETYTIEVRAKSTAGLKRDYDLSVSRAD